VIAQEAIGRCACLRRGRASAAGNQLCGLALGDQDAAGMGVPVCLEQRRRAIRLAIPQRRLRFSQNQQLRIQ
jgi:hypothetical protein